MSTEEFLSHLATLNVTIWAVGDRLQFRGPEEALTAELVAELGRRKSQLIDVVDRRDDGLASIQPAPRSEELELSLAQQRVWVLAELAPDNAFLTHLDAMHIAGPVDVDALERAFREIVRRHEALRTTFPSRGGVPSQQIGPVPDEIVRLVDQEQLSEPDRAAAFELEARAELHRPFDLAVGPVMRVTLLRRSATDHSLLVALHHIAGDAWSLGLLRRELASLYEAFTSGRASPLPGTEGPICGLRALAAGRGCVRERSTRTWSTGDSNWLTCRSSSSRPITAAPS